MEYKIVYVRNKTDYYANKELEEKVNELCQRGWKPQGGVSMSVWDDGNVKYTFMVQAMIK